MTNLREQLTILLPKMVGLRTQIFIKNFDIAKNEHEKQQKIKGTNTELKDRKKLRPCGVPQNSGPTTTFPTNHVSATSRATQSTGGAYEGGEGGGEGTSHLIQQAQSMAGVTIHPNHG